jgi:hypothetical protein
VARQFRSQSTMPETDPSSMPPADLIADEAARVGQSVKDAGDHVAHTAAGQAREVVGETAHQARGLLEQGRQQLREQAAFQQEKVALRLATVADELREMAHGSRSAPVSELADHGAESLHQLASWLKDHQPGDLLEEARCFAQRRPGVFLLGAALAGVVAGRLTSSGVAAVRQSDNTGSTPQRTAPPSPPTPASPPPPPASPPRSVTGPPPEPAPGSGHGPPPTHTARMRPGTCTETTSGQADSGTAYLAPPSTQPPVGSAPQTRSPRGAPDAGMSPYQISRDAATSLGTGGGDVR